MFVCVSLSIYLSIYQLKHTFVSYNVLLEFKNVCLCFFIYL